MPTEQETQVIDQPGQVDDFDYVPQDIDEAEPAAAPAPAKPAQPGKEAQQPAAPGAAKPVEPGKEAPVQPDPEKPDLLKEFFGEDGTLDLNKFASNFRPQTEAPKLENFTRPEVAGPKPVDTRADWEKFVEKRNEYEKIIRDNLGVHTGLIQKYISENYPGDATVQNFVRQLFAAINPQLDGMVRQEVSRWEVEARAKAEDERIKGEKDRYELAQTSSFPGNTSNPQELGDLSAFR